MKIVTIRNKEIKVVCSRENYVKFLENSYRQARRDDVCLLDKFEFISMYIFNFDTYDNEMDELLVKKALEICKAISDQNTYSFQKISQKNYQWYIIMCNMPFFKDKLIWGTSFRGAWWDHCDFTINTCGLYYEYEQIDSAIFSRAEFKEFIDAIADFVKNGVG